jgi:hypothetical protein
LDITGQARKQRVCRPGGFEDCCFHLFLRGGLVLFLAISPRQAGDDS